MQKIGTLFALRASRIVRELLCYPLNISLADRHKDEIRDIAISASKELELEVKMRGVEEEWTEQVLTFGNYKRRGPVLLVKEDSERLLEQLEDAQALLANMLTSKHIGNWLLV